VHVVSAWEIPEEDFLKEKMQADKLAKYAEDLQASADRRLKALLAKAGTTGGLSNVYFRKGYPARAILEYVESPQPDILVMGTVCKTDVGGLLVGNTADMVLRQVNCSVLAIKPDSLFRV
jgi:nucleotide-binding universal stress UspA family protein